MNRFMIKLSFAALTLAGSAMASASVINGDFSTGDLTGWSSVGSAYNPSGFAHLDTFSASAADVATLLGTTTSALNAISGVNATAGSAISQTFNLSSNGSVSFSFEQNSGDYLPYNDFSVVSIDGNLTLLSNVAATGNYGSSGWLSTSIALGAGTHTIGFAVLNAYDYGFNSNLLVDDVQAVPEPATMAVLGLGVAGILRRRRK